MTACSRGGIGTNEPAVPSGETLNRKDKRMSMATIRHEAKERVKAPKQAKARVDEK